MKVLLFVWMAACIVAAAKATHQQTEIESGNGLGMSIAHDDAASGPYQAIHFKVTLTNQITEDLTLIPGTLVDCGRAPSKTSAVKLNLTGPQGKQHRHLPYLGDGPPIKEPAPVGLNFTSLFSIAENHCPFRWILANTWTYLIPSSTTAPDSPQASIRCKQN